MVLLEMLIFFFCIVQIFRVSFKNGKKIANVFVIKTFFSAFGLSLYTQRLLTNDATVFRNRIHFSSWKYKSIYSDN